MRERNKQTKQTKQHKYKRQTMKQSPIKRSLRSDAGRNTKKIMDCCHIGSHNERNMFQCMRKMDGKVFSLPRRFTRKQCKDIRGFTMRSSCAPYKGCR